MSQKSPNKFWLSKKCKSQTKIVFGRVCLLGPWRETWGLGGTRGPELTCKSGRGKSLCSGPLIYKKDTWLVAVIAIFAKNVSV